MVKKTSTWYDCHSEDNLVSGPKGISSKTRKGWLTSLDLWSANPFCSPAELTPWPQKMLQLNIFWQIAYEPGLAGKPSSQDLCIKAATKGIVGANFRDDLTARQQPLLHPSFQDSDTERVPFNLKGHAGRHSVSTCSRKRLRAQPSEPESANWQKDKWHAWVRFLS